MHKRPDLIYLHLAGDKEYESYYRLQDARDKLNER
jgi:hypothetical protein